VAAMAYEGAWVGHTPSGALAMMPARAPADCHAARHLAAEYASGRAARDFVQQSLARWGWPGPSGDMHEIQELQDVLLLTSELAINAARHAHTPMDVTVRYRPGDRIRVEVHDNAGGLPQARWPATFEESGRGLALVELLSCAWGVTACGSGKTVWFELQLS
jgi:hypothetical protein